MPEYKGRSPVINVAVGGVTGYSSVGSGVVAPAFAVTVAAQQIALIWWCGTVGSYPTITTVTGSAPTFHYTTVAGASGTSGQAWLTGAGTYTVGHSGTIRGVNVVVCDLGTSSYAT